MAESQELVLKRMREQAARNALEADKLIKGPLAEAEEWALANPDPEIEKQAQLDEGPSIMSQERRLREAGAIGMVPEARRAAAKRAFLINASPVGSAGMAYEGGKNIVSGVKEGSPKKVAIGAAQGAAGTGMLGLDMAGLGLLTTGTGPLLRSKLADVVAALKPGEKVSTQGLGATLAKGGVKKVEMKANQLDSLVKAAEERGQKSISKEEILKHIEDNPVNLGQTQLGGSSSVRKEADRLFPEAEAPIRKFLEKDDRYAHLGLSIDDALHNVSEGYDEYGQFGLEDLFDTPWAEDFMGPNKAAWKRAAPGVGKQQIPFHFNFNPPSERDVTLHGAAFKDKFLRPIMESPEITHPTVFDRGTLLEDMVQRYEREVQMMYLGGSKLSLSQRAFIKERLPHLRAFRDKHTRALKDLEELYSDPAVAPWLGAAKKLMDEPSFKAPKWERITLPGGTNYQEILVTAPGKHSLDQGGDYLRPGPSWGTPFTESHHSKVPDVMAHIRTKDRVDLKGRKILFIEEFQSDWHQKGRLRGYSPEENRAIQENLEGYIEELKEPLRKAKEQRTASELAWVTDPATKNRFLPIDQSQSLFRFKYLEDIAQHEVLEDKFLKARDHLRKAKHGPVPPAPYRETKEWTDLLMKRAMREAAEGGYDGIAFTRGGDVSRISGMPEKSALHYYDRILPGSAQRVSRGKLEQTSIKLSNQDPTKALIGTPIPEEFPVVWLTDAVKGRAMLPYDKFAAVLAAGAAGGVGAKALQDNKTEEAQ